MKKEILSASELEFIKETCLKANLMKAYIHLVSNIETILHVFLLYGSVCLDVDGYPEVVENPWFYGGKALQLRFEIEDEGQRIELDVDKLPGNNDDENWLHVYEISPYCMEVLIGYKK